MSTVDGEVTKVVGYPRVAGDPVASVVLSVPPSPAARTKLWWLVAGVVPFLVPFAVWATVSYWRMPRSESRWRLLAAVVLVLELANFVGFMIYGYGRHYLVPPVPDYL
ncbi:hypothetical protein [Knoellia koreensis]|uniref:Uncharacterized protein n=1 Tax=Knoellia koreensis TaxID=2730921 RepID=A0A849H457_9MICO|nr:hypothetical protein [Knoellia sp. DB2414S]NNM44566.1 hypothetical protein [Knoellia sp. DB2414S]